MGFSAWEEVIFGRSRCLCSGKLSQVFARYRCTLSTVPGHTLLRALRRWRSFRRQGSFRDFVEEHAVPAVRQATGNALCGGLVGEGTYPDPVIWTFRALARGHVGLGKPVLYLLQHCLCMALLFKGSHLDLIHERLPELPSLQGIPARSPPPSCGACPAPANTMPRRAPPGSEALWRGSRGALGGTEEPCAQWGGRWGMLERAPPAGRRHKTV
jgi:hypothetical protein